MQSVRQVDFDELDAVLQSASALSTSLFRKVLEGCIRFESLRQAGKARLLDELAEAGAWTDATFRLLDLELPNWSIRRLVREGDDWLCTLSRQPNLPIALDDPVEAVHAVLPLAILRALIDVRRRLSMQVRIASPVPRIRPAPGIAVCCDNFV
jgi:hypothetical protein